MSNWFLNTFNVRITWALYVALFAAWIFSPVGAIFIEGYKTIMPFAKDSGFVASFIIATAVCLLMPVLYHIAYYIDDGSHPLTMTKCHILLVALLSFPIWGPVDTDYSKYSNPLTDVSFDVSDIFETEYSRTKEYVENRLHISKQKPAVIEHLLTNADRIIELDQEHTIAFDQCFADFYNDKAKRKNCTKVLNEQYHQDLKQIQYESEATTSLDSGEFIILSREIVKYLDDIEMIYKN